MALSNLFEWNKEQGDIPASACGAGDKNASEGSMEEKPAACGSACGAGDISDAGLTPVFFDNTIIGIMPLLNIRSGR